MKNILAAVSKCPLVPVLTITDAGIAGDLAHTLLDAGLTTAEVTLRTDAALDAIKIMKREVPALMVGAGTVLTSRDIEATVGAGSDFIVTPATTPSLRKALKEVDCPVFPGVATPSEALVAYEAGFNYQKFYPAESNGGVKALKSFGGPFPDITFMPTGGINCRSVSDYLSCSNVIAVGGSWMVDNAAIKSADWSALKKHVSTAIKALKVEN